MMAGARCLDATLDQCAEVHAGPMSFASTTFAGLEHLPDRIHQPVGVLKHEAVELASLAILNFPSLQGLEI